MRLLRRRVIVCQEWVELVTDYLEGALPRHVRKAIDRHLAACPHCTEYLAQMRRTIAVTGELPVDTDVPDDLLDALQRAFEDFASSDHDADGADGADGADDDRPDPPGA
jgi:anti-sigma factor RsiW